MPGKIQLLSAALIVLVNLQADLCAYHCPYCPRTEATLSEKLSQSVAACVVKFLSSKNGDELSQQTTTFEVVTTLPGKDRVKKGEQIVVNFGRTGKPGDQFLMLGKLEDGSIEWSLPIPLDEVGSVYTYLTKAPSFERPINERLTYFLRFLDSDNSEISNDAFGEFARAQFEEVAAISTKFSRADLRKWLEDPNPQLDVRRAFYGMVLGLCGNDDDANFLEKKILEPIDPYKTRLFIDGMMAGYLLLRGSPGLQLLVEKKINELPQNLPPDDPRLVDLNALMVTDVFLWDYRRAQFKEEPLRAAMRRLLERPECAELAIIHLTRWKDWESLDYLIGAYGHEPWETRSAKEKIVLFVLTCQKDVETTPGEKPHLYAAKAKEFLDHVDKSLVETAKLRRSAP